MRQAAEERAATAEHQFSLLQLELKKSKSEMQMLEENLASQQAVVSPTPNLQTNKYIVINSWRLNCVVIKT